LVIVERVRSDFFPLGYRGRGKRGRVQSIGGDIVDRRHARGLVRHRDEAGHQRRGNGECEGRFPPLISRTLPKYQHERDQSYQSSRADNNGTDRADHGAQPGLPVDHAEFGSKDRNCKPQEQRKG